METKQRDDGLGYLPGKAPLANPYVPFQMKNPKRYCDGIGLVRGTSFPGLDLPFHGMVNDREKGKCGLILLQELGFAIQELTLYLDTHKGDYEALELLRKYQKAYREAHANYTRMHGPLTMFDTENGDYAWVKSPWPWEYAANREG